MTKKSETELPKGAKTPERTPEDGVQNDPHPVVDDIQKGAASAVRMMRSAADELRSILR